MVLPNQASSEHKTCKCQASVVRRVAISGLAAGDQWRVGLLVEVFGEAARHVRAAIGVAALPRYALAGPSHLIDMNLAFE